MSEPIAFRDDITIKIDTEGVGFTLGARDYKGVQCVAETFSLQAFGTYKEDDTSSTLKSRDYKDATDLVTEEYTPEVAHTLKGKANCDFREDSETYVCSKPETEKHMPGSVVRRLTPLECERLQNFPDNWSKYGLFEDGTVKEIPASARYRIQGNSIARPFWTWLMRRIAAQYERQATLGSLFDGQGGFPLCWKDAGGKTLWVSEIEKYAVAVTKYNFREE